MFLKKKSITLSKDHNPNYVATVCRIGTLSKVENADKLQKTVINGYDIIVDMNYHENDIVVYFTSETVICDKFLSKNNLYNIGDYEKNENHLIVERLLKLSAEMNCDDYKNEAKQLCGFFGKAGRVKIIRLRGQVSNGFIIKTDIMDEFIGKIINWESLIGEKFDTINGELFCWKYIPPIKEIPSAKTNESRWSKLMKRINRHTSRLIPGQFELHYFTKKLNDNMNYFHPDDNCGFARCRQREQCR